MKAAILDFRSVARPQIAAGNLTRIDAARPIAPDRPLLATQKLACRWRRDADGCLTAHWESAAAAGSH